MNKDEMMKVAKLALEKTRDGSVPWEAADGKAAYKVDFSKSSIVVWENNSIYGFVLLNSRGDEVGSISTQRDNSAEVVEILKNLHGSVVSCYLQIDETMRDVFEGLEGRSKPDDPMFF